AFLDSEGTEAHQDHGITCLQSTSDGFDHSVQRTTSNGFRDISRCGDGIDQFRLVHSKSPYLTLMKLFFTVNLISQNNLYTQRQLTSAENRVEGGLSANAC